MGQNTFIWLIPQALEMIDQIGRSNFGICLDTWNNWQDPDVLDHIQECGKLITVVHVSDWHLPRSYADRTIPGEGQIPIAELLGAIDATGYKGAYSLEIFSDESLPDSLWLQDGRTVISKSKAGFDKAWAGR
jgi:sugar phosphate isomerase/epimerase